MAQQKALKVVDGTEEFSAAIEELLTQHGWSLRLGA